MGRPYGMQDMHARKGRVLHSGHSMFSVRRMDRSDMEKVGCRHHLCEQEKGQAGMAGPTTCFADGGKTYRAGAGAKSGFDHGHSLCTGGGCPGTQVPGCSHTGPVFSPDTGTGTQVPVRISTGDLKKNTGQAQSSTGPER